MWGMKRIYITLLAIGIIVVAIGLFFVLNNRPSFNDEEITAIVTSKTLDLKISPINPAYKGNGKWVGNFEGKQFTWVYFEKSQTFLIIPVK
jgi:hypothetical protein